MSRGRNIAQEFNAFKPLKDQRTLEEEIKDFAFQYGYSKEHGRRYGELEKSGRLINFFYNRFFKNDDSHGQQDFLSSTVEAFYTTYDKKAPSDERDNAISIQYPDGKDANSRNKKVKYGNHNAMWAVLSSHMYGLTGLNSPDNRMMTCEEFQEDKIPDIYIASALIPGYYDLGNFLVDEKIISSFVKPADMPKWLEQIQKIKEIEEGTKRPSGTALEEGSNKSSANAEQTITAQDKLERIKALITIYRMMPDYVHEEIEKSYAVSKFTHNWDYANFNLNNIGVKFAFNSQREVVSFESVFVDHDNQAESGYGGRKKENSLDRANTEAKKITDKPYDYDPQLAFTEEEKGLIALKLTEAQERGLIKQLIDEVTRPIELIYEELSNKKKLTELTPEEIELRKSIRFKDAHHLLPGENFFRIDSAQNGEDGKPSIDRIYDGVTTGLLSISDVPRNLPFYKLFTKTIKQKSKKISDLVSSARENAANNMLDLIAAEREINDRDITPQRIKEILESEAKEISEKISKLLKSSEFYRDSELESAFRFSLITDEAIERTAKNWYLYEEFPQIFKPKNPDDVPTATTEEVADLFKKRRDLLANSIPKEAVDEWVANNPLKAIATQRSVAVGNLKEKFEVDPDFEEKYPFARGGSESELSKSNDSAQSPTKSQIQLTKIQSSKSFARTTSGLSLTESDQGPSVDLTSSCINQENSFEARIKAKKSVREIPEVGNILSQIHDREKAVNAVRDSKIARQTTMITKIPKDLDRNLKDTLMEGIENEKFKIEAESLIQIISFFSDNVAGWKKLLKLDSQPNNYFLALTQASEIYRLKKGIRDLSIDGNALMFGEEGNTRNKFLHEQNQYVYKDFIKDLRKLSADKSLTPNSSITTIGATATSPSASSPFPGGAGAITF